MKLPLLTKKQGGKHPTPGQGPGAKKSRARRFHTTIQYVPYEESA